MVAAALPLAPPANAARPGAAAAAVRLVGIAWKSCGKQLQCAKVSVPLNWHRPDGTHIRLAVIRRLASDQRHLIGSMFVNPGGPGESGVDLVRSPASGRDLLAWGGGRFNVVGWDPRGTNESDPVCCFTSQASAARFWRGVQIPTTPAESQAYERKVIELARRCGQVSGQLLDNISTEDSARDLNYLRQLVGDRALTYVGLSYGTFLGQTYANLFPTWVRAMILDGVVDQKTWVESAEARLALTVSGSDDVFARFVALCQRAGPARCALARHSETVAQRVAGLFRQARRTPVPAPHADPPGVLSYGDLLLSTFQPLRSPLLWPQYARELDAAASGDASALEMAARQLRTPAAYSKATTSAAIQCLDGPASELVSAWPRAIAHLNNLYDPASGYANAQRAARLLGSAVLLTVNSYGHPSYALPSACADKWRVRYLVNLVTPPPGTVCGNVLPFRSAASSHQNH